jgi:hypothetical protein
VLAGADAENGVGDANHVLGVPSPRRTGTAASSPTVPARADLSTNEPPNEEAAADKAGLAWRSTVGAYRTDALARPRRVSGGVFNLSPKSGLAVAWLYGLTLSPRTR